MLALQIDNNYHLRVGNSSNNFKNSLSLYDSDLVNNTIKDPYIFDFITLKDEYKECTNWCVIVWDRKIYT